MKKNFCITFFLTIISLLLNYFSMYEFNINQSSSCYECSYLKEILIINIQSLLMIPLVYLIEKFLEKYKVVLYSIILASNIFFLNLSVFISRVSSWSTYTATDEFIAVFYHSVLWIIGSVFILNIFFLISKKNRFCIF